MLYEIKNVKKFDQGHRFRCFSDDYFDLFIWHDLDNDEIIQFQIIYDKFNKPHGLTWNRDKGFIHTKIDDGEYGWMKKSPILVKNGIVPKDFLINKFTSHCSEIDESIREFIFDKLSGI